MNLRIQWTPIALLSLSEVFEYTFEELGERQLRRLQTQISSTARRIAIFPGLGKQESDLVRATGIEYRSKLIIDDSAETLELTYSYNLSEQYYDASFYGGVPTYRGQFADCLLDTIYMGRNISFPESPDGKGDCIPFKADGASSFYPGTIQPSSGTVYLTFGENVTSIPDKLFISKRIVNEVEFPAGLKYIGAYSFNKNIGPKFYNVLTQTELTIPECFIC